MATTIYQLRDPLSGEIRYIGKTVKRLADRLCAHMCDSRAGRRNHLHHWLRSLPTRPTIEALVVVENDLAFQTERAAIALFRTNGCRLVNATDGGEGAPGHRCPEEKKAALSAMMRGRKAPPRSDEWRRRMSAAKRGSKLTAEHRAKIAAGLVGRVTSEATRAKQRDVKLGKVFTEEHRANLSAAIKGRRASEATREKMRAAFTPERRRQMADSRKGRPKSPESVERGAAKLRGRTLSAERVEQIRATTLAYWARQRAKVAPQQD